jgi:hypothetical protein
MNPCKEITMRFFVYERNGLGETVYHGSTSFVGAVATGREPPHWRDVLAMFGLDKGIVLEQSDPAEPPTIHEYE